MEALHTQIVRYLDSDPSFGYGLWSLAKAIDLYYGMTGR